MSQQEQADVQRLQKRDAEVRRHEQAHAAAGGAYAGAPSYQFEAGPDGKRYAVGGEVSIDTSEIEGDTAASISKLEQVARAAMAPEQPSGQDNKVAASARAKLARLRAEMRDESDTTETRVDGGSARRAASAYARAGADADAEPVSTMKLVACSNCGSSHSL